MAQTTRQDGQMLNHVAIKVVSVAASKAFYIDLLGMKEIFTVDTGRFTAHYLGSATTPEETSKEILASLGTRSGLLELIHEDPYDSTETGGDLAPKKQWGFVHLGFRVPDVAETLRRARQGGWTVLGDLGGSDISADVLPGRPLSHGQAREWKADFLGTLAQIGFVADPDGNVIELLPKILLK